MRTLKDKRLDPATARARPVRQQEKDQPRSEPRDARALPPPPSLAVPAPPAPAGKPGLPPAQHPSSSSCSPSSARTRATNLGRADVLHGGPTSARSWAAAASRTCARLQRGGRGAGRGLRARERAGHRAWLRLQVRRRPREAGVRARGASAALERARLRAPATFPACGSPAQS